MRKDRYEVNKKLWEFANRLSDIDEEIRNRNIFISQAYNPLKATAIDGLPRAKGKVNDTTQATTILIERYQREVLSYIQEKELTLGAFGSYISVLPDKCKKTVRMFYTEGRSVLQIAFKMNCSEDNVNKILAKARDLLR